MEQTLPPPEVYNALPPVYPTLKESWAAFGWCVLITLLLGALALLVTGGLRHADGLLHIGAIALASEAGIAATIWWLRRRAGLRWPGLALWGPWEKWPLYALLPIIVLAQVALLSAVSLLHLPSPNDKLYQQMARYPALLLGIGCVAAPVLEELLFRGVLLKGLLRNYRPAVAIAQSALLFGLIHFSPAQSIATALMGGLLGWVYYRTRSLGMCIGLHALNNLLALSAMRNPRLANEDNMLNLVSPGHYLLVLVVAAVVLGSSLWWMHRALPPIPAATLEDDAFKEATTTPLA